MGDGLSEVVQLLTPRPHVAVRPRIQHPLRCTELDKESDKRLRLSRFAKGQ